VNTGPRYCHFYGQRTFDCVRDFYTSPSRCAVADGCSISVDRHLTRGETWENALEEIRELPSVIKTKGKVKMYNYNRPSYTGLIYPTECYFPSWVLDEDHAACKTLAESFTSLFNQEPVVDKWTFSTNGVSIMGRYGIPCIGFGPVHEDQPMHPMR